MSELVLLKDPHPLLDACAFVTQLPGPLAALDADLTALLRLDAEAPLQSSDAVRGHVRDLLRHGGYKPTGRGKPASEYLLRAAGGTGEAPTLGGINALVDACNVVSLHSGLPISVIDLDRAVGAQFRLGLAAPKTTYVFNASGQSIDVGGLLCLFDGEGPCANAVKDAQRTKTHDGTQRTLSIVWGSSALPGHAAAASDWYRRLLESTGATTHTLTPLEAAPAAGA